MTSSDARAMLAPLAARGARRVTLVMAGGMLALGLLLIFRPNDSLAVTAALVGTALLATGVLRLVRGVSAGRRSGTHRGTHLLIGTLAVLAGTYCLGDTALTVVQLSLVAGLFWVMHGLVDLVAAGSAAPARALTGVTGGLGLLAGLIVIFWPGVTVPVMATVTGIWLACDGVLLAATALYLRHLARATAARALRSRLGTNRGFRRRVSAVA